MKLPRVVARGFIHARALLALVLCSAAIALGLLAFKASAQQQNPPADADESHAIFRGVMPVVQFDVSPPLSELARTEPTTTEKVQTERGDLRGATAERVRPGDIDQAVQSETGAGEIATPRANFDAFDGTGSTPSDSVAAVGPNRIVVMANKRYAVYSKTGTTLASPANINTLWSGFGGACQIENAGDPIVLYDRRADRWVLTQFTRQGPTFFNCVAVSQTSDPLGSYYRYAINAGSNLPDYPKYATWPDAYFISTREFDANDNFVGVGAYALNRTQMLAGVASPSVLSYIVVPGSTRYRIGDGLLPADMDSWMQPPAGAPGLFLGIQDNGVSYGAPSDGINIWKFHVDFAAPANSSFTFAQTLSVAAFDSIFPCSPTSRECIPQGGTTQKVDHLGRPQFPMFRAAYRRFATHESMVLNHSVHVSGVSGVRWYEVRNPSSTPTVYQQGTYAPGVSDGIHRWMGSIAMDGLGNIALGYSASNASMFPAIRYTGRYAASTLNTMPLGEGVIVNGNGSQTGSNRWGDYTAMTVDPTDDLTFWYVNQYYPMTSPDGWRLRVGSFRLANLAAGATSITSENCTPANNAVDPGETVTMRFCVRNTSQTSTGNVVGTLLSSGGVTNPSAPELYGVIAPGATFCRPFTFTANGTCNGVLNATVRFQAGTEDLGRQTYPVALGHATILSEDFDGVAAPALPSGWTTTQGVNPGGASPWVTADSGDPAPTADSFPNSAFTGDPAAALDNRLVSPSFTYPAGALLSFRHSYNLVEQSASTANSAAVLEISVNSGPFNDIINAGGSFVSGGYDHTGINSFSSNPLQNRPNWSGSSDGFITTLVTLPNSAAGQPVRLRWRLGSDSTLFRIGRGWRVDDVLVSNYGCCGNAPTAQVVSRKTHGAAGSFDIAVPLSGTPGIESRSGGATSDHTLVATFGGLVSVSGTPQAQILDGTGTMGTGGVSNGGTVSVGGAGNVVTIRLTNIGDAQTLTLRLNSVNGTGDVLIPMSVLLGDINRTGTVNASDIGAVKAQSGVPVTSANFRADAAVSGSINATDISLVKSRSGQSVP